MSFADRHHIAAIVLLVFAPQPGRAETPVQRAPQQRDAKKPLRDITELSMKDLLNTEVGVASVTQPHVQRASPGIVTLVTRQEIVNSGARDLLDILQLVPGFAFGHDTEGAISIGVRGTWATEGKVLLLVDGHEINERLYSNVVFGNHFPAEIIEKVEIIRGPGSAIHGGYAELAVIKVSTRAEGELDGAAAFLYYGQMLGTLGRLNAGLSVAHEFKSAPGLRLSVSAALGLGRRSDRTYQDFYGTSYSLGGGNSAANPGLLSAVLRYKDLQLRLLYDSYRTRTRDSAYDAVLPVAETNSYTTLSTEARYDWRISPRLTLTPLLSYKQQEPWHSPDRPESPQYYRKTVERYLGRLALNWLIVDRQAWELRWLIGTECAVDRAWLQSPVLVTPNNQPWEDPDGTLRNSVNSTSVAAYTEAFFANPIANLTAGARYEYFTAHTGAFVPRLGLTRSFGPVHAKLLYSESYRAPALENLRFNRDLRPEHARTAEAELGYQPLPQLYLVANVFWTTIRDPIIYTFLDPTHDTYINQTQTGAVGMELVAGVRHQRGHATLTYSFYHTAGLNEVETYKVEPAPGEVKRDVVLGLPQHKVTLNGSLRLWRTLSVNPSAVIMTGRWGYLSGDAQGVGVVGQTAPTFLLNLFVQYKDLFTPGLDVGVGAFNLLNQDYRYVQPYDGGHAPMPATSIELVGRLSYTRPF